MTAEAKFMALLARLDKPESRALPQQSYRDPARSVKFTREGKAMQRDIDEVEVLLDLWADWMRKPEGLAEGYPSKASGGFIESWRKDDEDEEDARLAERVARIDAAFDSLQRIYQDAINRHYGLGHQVWRFAKDTSFDDAKIVMRVKLVTKGLL